MQAKPVKTNQALTVSTLFVALAGYGFKCAAQDEVKAPPPIPVVLFDSGANYEDQLPKVVVQTRDALRDNPRFEVLLFNPDSPTFILAAKSGNISLSPADLQTPAQLSAVASAVGATYYIVLTPTEKSKKVTVDMVLLGAGGEQSISSPENPGQAAKDIENELLNWPVTAPLPVVPSPAPATVASPVITPAPPAPVQVAVPPALVQQAASPPNPVAVEPQIVTPVPTTPLPVTAVPPFAAPAVPPTLQAAPTLTPAPASPIVALPNAPMQTPVVDQGAQAQQLPPVLSNDNPQAVVPPTLDNMDRATGSNESVVRKQTTPTSSAVEHNAPIQPDVVTSTVVKAPATFAPSAPMTNYEAPSASPTVALPPTKPVDNVVMNGAGVDGANRVSTPTATAPISGGLAGTSKTSAEQLGVTMSDTAKQLIGQGDDALRGSDYLTAIGCYNKAVDLAPRAVTPRLKLASAYLADGLKDQASEEARRALAIDPGSTDVQKFIQDQDFGVGGPGGDVIIAQAQTESDPNNPAGWINLGDAYWNVGDPDDSLISYKRAADIDPNAILPQTRLAKLYAARAQYDESLAALQRSGSAGYPYALKIIASRSESLVGDIDDETDMLQKGTDTREQFYDKIKTTSTQAAGLADFVAKITPPDQYKVSQLHRELSTSLLAQAAAVWVDYAETNNDSDKTQAADLEKHAIEEMKTASVAEDLQSRIKP